MAKLRNRVRKNKVSPTQRLQCLLAWLPTLAKTPKKTIEPIVSNPRYLSDKVV